jgi:glycolate oxidase
MFQKLIEIVGKENFTDHMNESVSYHGDLSMNARRPYAAVRPESTEQVCEIIKSANEHLIPVIPRGAGTGLSRDTVSGNGGIIVELSRMNHILEISIENRYVQVQAGVVCDDLNRSLAKNGFVFPPEPASSSASTIGGNVATNATGIKGAKYGTTRDYVMGLEAVLPIGEVLNTGSRTMKCVSGYDLSKLLVGSEGTLGIITEVTLKVNPIPRHTTAVAAFFNSLEDAGKTISQSMTSGSFPGVLEIMDKVTLKSIREHADIDLPEGEAMILTETGGYTSEEVETQTEAILTIFKQNHPTMAYVAKDEKERLTLWKARKSAYAALARTSKSLLLPNVKVSVSGIPELLAGIHRISQESRMVVATYGHAGDGNLHFQILYDECSPEHILKAESVKEEILRLALSIRETLCGSHGTSLSGGVYETLEHDPVETALMKKIKKTFDPNNIMKPGKGALD